MVEYLTIGNFSVHQFISTLLIVFTFELIILGWLRKRWKKLDDLLLSTFNDAKIPDRYKIWFMVIATIFSIFLYLYCWICQITETAGPGDDREYLDWLFRDLLGILPWFIWGCVIAGFITKYMGLGKIRLPKTMLGAGALASILPICSCAAVPMAHGMMMGKQMRLRAIITFLLVVPVLSPIGMLLAFSRIGWQYLLVEIISIFALAMFAGIVIERYAGAKEPGDCREGCYSCQGCSSSQALKSHDSPWMGAWDQLMHLMKYIFVGIMIGAAISVFVSPDTIAQIFGSAGDFWGSIPGLLLIVCLGVPLFICDGEEVLILAPMLAAGVLPLGHAIAFAITGNAVCITAVPVLTATFGKKVTILIFTTFFFGSILLGLIINALVLGFT